MARLNPWRWVVLGLAALYFLVPLASSVIFTVDVPGQGVTFDAYSQIVSTDGFVSSLLLSLELALATIEGLREGIYGQPPVMLALYSMGGPNTVVCGIQPRDGSCLFYLHRIEQDDVPDLSLAGVGRHARHLEFASPKSVPDKVLAGLLKLSVKRLE